MRLQGKVVQNDSGLDSNLFRPGADFLATFETISSSQMKIHFSADGFQAAEAFWIPKRGSTQIISNSSFAVKTAPSAFGMMSGELDFVQSAFTGCWPFNNTVRSSQGCVALDYEVDGFLTENG